MSLELEGTRLWNVQEWRDSSNGSVRIDAIYGDNAEQTLLTGLESVEEIEITGTASGYRLANEGGYSNDPVTALAEWVAEVESYVNGRQGEGWTLEDTRTGDTQNSIIELFGFQREAGAKYEVSWDLSMVNAQAMMADSPSSPEDVSPSTTATLDGIDLDSVDVWREQKRQDVEVYPIAFAQEGENEALANSGAYRQVMIRGERTGTYQERGDFDDSMKSLIGQDNIVTYSSSFPGREMDVMVKEYESTEEAGLTRIGEYILELVEGTG